MKCPKCQNETFKARVVRGRRVKEHPEVIPVNLICAECGHNVKAYLSREDLKFIKRKLDRILIDSEAIIAGIVELGGLAQPKKRKWFWQR